MEVFYNRHDIEQQLGVAFRDRYARKDVALTGILLAEPADEIAKKSILPRLEAWSYRSDYYTDFFCAGYVPREFVRDAKSIDVNIHGIEWGFSLPAFMEIVTALEAETKWKYNGDSTLLLLNSYFDGKEAKIDFHRSLRLNFREALRVEVAATPTELVNAIFGFAKSINESSTDPVWELSDELGRRILKSGFKEIALSLLPSWLTPTTKRALEVVLHQN